MNSVQSITDPVKVAANLLIEIHNWANTIVQMWNQYLEVAIRVPHGIASILCKEFNQTRAGTFSEFAIQSEAKILAFPFHASRDVRAEHENLTKVIRASIRTKGMNTPPVPILA